MVKSILSYGFCRHRQRNAAPHINAPLRRTDLKNGFIILNKPAGISSHTAVAKVKRLLGAEKAGHTGTLDPLADGVLPILIGRGVKASEYIISKDKHYRAVMLLGKESDTEDISGTVTRECRDIPEDGEVLHAIEAMKGKSMQTPPMYSALKVGGKKLYELARRGEVIEREAREINIYEIKAEKLSPTEWSLDISCSKGTYIRTVCRDIGERLGCGALMKSLTRLEAAGYSLKDACTIEELEALSEDERMALIRPTEELFASLCKLKLANFYARLAKNGLEIYLSKIGKHFDVGERVTLYDENGFFALGEVMEFEAGLAIKPIKQFEL